MTWFLLRTKPRQESYAGHNVVQLGALQAYAPKYYDEKKDQQRVLFPSYLFVETSGWFYNLMGAFGVVCLVKTMWQDNAVRPEIIDALREREKDGLVQIPPRIGLRVGQRVVVTKGPFAGFYGLYQGQKDRHRVGVLLDLFERKTPVTLRTGSVVADGVAA